MEQKKIRTWNDVLDVAPETGIEIKYNCLGSIGKLNHKIIATFKICKILEYGYRIHSICNFPLRFTPVPKFDNKGRLIKFEIHEFDNALDRYISFVKLEDCQEFRY